MFNKRMNFIKNMPIFLCLIGLSISLFFGFSPIQAQTNIAADSLLFPEYRYYDEPVNPDLYLIRPGDHLVVTFIGTSLPALGLKVGPDGLIVNQNLGTFDMTNLTLTEARGVLKEPLKLLYNCDKIHISVGSPYRVAISVNGAVRNPGTYLGFTSQRVSEIIELAGGVNSNGSSRLIKFSGGPNQLAVDLDLAIYGADNLNNFPLYAGVSIFIPRASAKKIHLIGEFARTIELLESDNLKTITKLAGGGNNSNGSQLMVFKESWQKAKENDLVNQAIFQLSKPKAGMALSIFGGVNKPGRFEYSDNFSLADLIEYANGFTEHANQKRIAIFRKLPNDAWGNQSDIRIPIAADPLDDQTIDILFPDDSVFVPVTVGYIQVVGQVRSPGYYPYRNNMTIKDYVIIAGGFTKQADNENLIIKNSLTGFSLQAALDAIPADGDQVRVEKREELQ